jgi:hypothetical protein
LTGAHGSFLEAVKGMLLLGKFGRKVVFTKWLDFKNLIKLKWEKVMGHENILNGMITVGIIC